MTMEASRVARVRQVGKHNVSCIYEGILFNLKKETLAFVKNIEELSRHCHKSYMLLLTYALVPQRPNHANGEESSGCQGAARREDEGLLLTEHALSFAR